MSEEWRPVPGYEGLYEASSEGRVRNKRGHVLAANTINAWGYRQISLSKKRKIWNTKVHRVICFAFHPIVDGKPHVNHIDGDKLNNRADNLEWVSKYENEEHARQLGRAHASSNPKRGWRLTVENVIDIRRRFAEGESCAKLGVEFGANPNYLRKVIKGQKRQRG